MYVSTTDSPLLQLDQQAKVYAHLDEKEIQAIAKAVSEELKKSRLPLCLRCNGTGTDPYIEPRLGTQS